MSARAGEEVTELEFGFEISSERCHRADLPAQLDWLAAIGRSELLAAEDPVGVEKPRHTFLKCGRVKRGFERNNRQNVAWQGAVPVPHPVAARPGQTAAVVQSGADSPEPPGRTCSRDCVRNGAQAPTSPDAQSRILTGSKGAESRNWRHESRWRPFAPVLTLGLQ